MGFIDLINKIDFAILDFIRDHLQNSFFDKIFPIISKLADEGIFWIVLAIFLLCDKSTRKTAIKMGIALALGLAIGNGIIKNLVGRIRPYDLKEQLTGIHIDLLVPKLKDWSFPSGHTLASFEAAGVLMICEKKRFGIVALVFAILIALSRLYLYVHYPSDVIAGVILGLLFAFVACKLVDLVVNAFMNRRRSEKSKKS